MSYDLAVWEGDRLDSDDAAATVYEQLMGRLESDDTTEPSPAIRSYVEALLARWPDITEEGGEDSPWAEGPLIGDASGNAIYFSMVWSEAEQASEFAAQLAAQHGLICFDPQTEMLRPAPASHKRRSWFRRSR